MDVDEQKTARNRSEQDNWKTEIEELKTAGKLIMNKEQ